MFEQNSNTGYVLKPQVLWNKSHPEYGRFNPVEKKKENDYVSFSLKIISGQYLTENSGLAGSSSSNSGNAGNYAGYGANYTGLNTNNPAVFNNNYSYHHHHRSSAVEILQTASTYVEVEILGIQCDCTKERTKTLNKNALNPIWNEEFVFHVI